MLLNLSIQNVAVIEKADVDFTNGFNILTGETGAGKSILIDSLSMVLGMRTSRDLIRSSAPFASVDAVFSENIDLSEFDIPQEEDNSIILSRKIYPDGKNICKINSRSVNLSTLRSVGERLVAIHGQHDNIALLKPSYHLTLLDEFANTAQLLSEYREAFNKAHELIKKLADTYESESEREMKKDTLNFRIEEIKAVSPAIDEDFELAQKRDALRNFSTIMANLNSAADALSSQGGAKDALYASMRNLESAASKDSALNPICEQLTDLYYSCEDLSSQISSYVSRMSFSPSELDMIEERLDLITRLKKKYGPELSDVMNNLSLWEEEYSNLLFYTDNIAKLEKEKDEAWLDMINTGEKLHSARLAAAEKLSQTVASEMEFLNMPKSSFKVAFGEFNPTSRGLYDAEFLISTIPGEEAKPLVRIASGGEMSRIMLALKSALSDCSDVGTLLFDEIDAGVSGKAAIKIAEKLKSLSSDRQIICITHLAQMASKAATHLLISKDTTGDAFKTTVTPLDTEGRIQELTRLISGTDSSDAARLAAIEMLGVTS